ncbi:unnamed protein product [Rotaria magnacalcarata]|uniref:Uncharacterized protein n=1 Tax=Rotaria magnacalcarata TaxID=392030 RepID=A0A817AK16_9BILA|nr:unnamed protein product [Rotaria magnacalcarata]
MTFTSTSRTDWTRSDIYHNSFLIPPNNALTTALKLSEKHELPPYAVSEAQGKFLNLLTQSIRARRMLEIGKLGGEGVIIVDNVVRNGGVAGPDQSDLSIDGVRKWLEYIGNDPTTEATTLRTVGEKGYDGFLYAVNKPQHQLELHFMTDF